MSDTPRTDAVAARRMDPEITDALAQEQFVPASFARLLERELATARSRYVHEIPDWMVIDAFRYACGRQSYQVGVTCRWLVENWERVPATAKTIIREELEKAFDEDNKQRSCGGMYGSMFLRLGSDIDRREWLAVLNLARYSAAQRCEGDQS